MDKIKLLLDEDVHSDLGPIIRKRGFDVVHTQEVEGRGRTDLQQLAYACEQQRCLMSYNVKDFVLLHNRYARKKKELWGIIVSKQLPIGETLRRLLRVLHQQSQKSVKNRIFFLSKGIPADD